MRSVSVRISQARLDLIDNCLVDEPLANRSRLMRRCARIQATRVLKDKAPFYISEEEETDVEFRTITVCLSQEDEDLINAACLRLNHTTSPFIVQSTIAYLDQDA